MEYKRKSHSVYMITYHIVFVSKYRRPFITDEIGDYLKALCSDICIKHGGELISGETDKDHMHLLISMPQHESPAGIIRVLKAQTSRKLRCIPEYDRHIKKFLFGGKSMWSPSYFVSTTGGAPLEKIKEYIESQRSDAHHQKYLKPERDKRH